MKVVVLDVFAMVPLRVSQAKGPFLQDRINAIPKGHGKAEAALVITQTKQAILPPAIGPRAGMVMGKGGPGIAIGGVVLPHGAPLALGQVTPPEGPGLGLPITLDKPLKFGNLSD